jgi:hypothetical protein
LRAGGGAKGDQEEHQNTPARDPFAQAVPIHSLPGAPSGAPVPSIPIDEMPGLAMVSIQALARRFLGARSTVTVGSGCAASG